MNLYGMNLYTWGVRGFFAVMGLFWAWVGLTALIDWLKRGKRDAAELSDPVCLWCRPTPAGKAGRCICAGKCEDVPRCIGIGPPKPQASGAGSDGDTGVRDWSADEIKYLNGELKELPK